MGPKYLAVIALLASLAGCFSSTRRPSSTDSPRYQNRLLPFTSDGCSKFPNGIPYDGERNWLTCCVQHDIAYWQGGTAEQRDEADLGLKACVTPKAGWVIAEAMYLGVRLGGTARLPTSWKWGYGWVIDRGYHPLTTEEEEQVRVMSREIPDDLTKVQIQHEPVVPQRGTVSGDYCFDAAIAYIEMKLGRSFQVATRSDHTHYTGRYFQKVLEVRPDGCHSPFRFTFRLNSEDSCTTRASEWTARRRIRLQAIGPALGC